MTSRRASVLVAVIVSAACIGALEISSAIIFKRMSYGNGKRLVMGAMHSHDQFVGVKPVPGWKVAVTRATLATPVEVEGQTVRDAVSRVVWTAESAATAVQPGQYQEFGLSVGPLPTDTDRLVFKALQT